jgi:anti-sigma factor RsiW
VSTKHEHGPCQELLAQLSDYIDGELDAALCIELETHLAQCQDCRVMVDTVRKTITLYSVQSSPALPEDVAARLLRALDLE